MTEAPVNLPSSGPPTPDELVVSSFGVKHGDCTLVEALREGCVRFRLLCDAGVAAPAALFAHVARTPHERGDGFIDVVVLTHVDHDHQGGLAAVFEGQGVRVGEFWGPCLPAFKRLRWLFQKRVFDAIDRAGELERLIADRQVPVLYPMEGHAKTFSERRVTVSVLSPANRMIRELAYGSEQAIRRLVTHAPLPAEWLISGSELDTVNLDHQILRARFDARTYLAPEDFPEALPELQFDSPGALGAQLVAGGGPPPEPDFFGNHVLNDTSLVLVLDVLLDGKRRRRVLLTGDQENWSYIASRHPTGLGADILKVPHHGGRVFLADKQEEDAIEQLYLWLRPHVAMVSAMGQHRLPHVRTREALRQAGATLLCPNSRGFEPLSPGAVLRDSPCCFDAYGCREKTVGQAEQVTVRLTSEAASAQVPACLQGTLHHGPAPIVVQTQRIVEPDETFVRWTRTEVEKQAAWIRDRLRARHEEFLALMDGSPSPYALIEEHVGVTWRELDTLARARGHLHLAEDPEPVLRFAVARGLVLSASPQGYGGRDTTTYYLPPATTAVEALRSWVRRVPHFLFTLGRCNAAQVRSGNRIPLLQACNTEVLEWIGACLLRLPPAFVRQAVLPRLIVDLAHGCSAKVCSLAYPSKGLHGHGDALLHLYRDDANAPDLFSREWLDGYWNSPQIARQMEFFLRAAGPDAVLGVHHDPSRNAERHVFSAFMPPSRRGYGDRDFSPGHFAEALRQAHWTTAWQAQAAAPRQDP